MSVQSLWDKYHTCTVHSVVEPSFELIHSITQTHRSIVNGNRLFQYPQPTGTLCLNEWDKDQALK